MSQRRARTLASTVLTTPSAATASVTSGNWLMPQIMPSARAPILSPVVASR